MITQCTSNFYMLIFSPPFIPHLQAELLEERDEEGEAELQEGHDVVRLKLLVLLGQHARDVDQLGVPDGVPLSRDHATNDVGDEHVELPVQALGEFGK